MKKILGIIYLLSISGVAGGAEPSSLYHVFVFGDLQGREQTEIYKRTIGECNRLLPDFAISVGDQIHFNDKVPQDCNPAWDHYLDLIKDLKVPIYLTPGNHDIPRDFAEPIWTERIGKPPCYSFDYGKDHYTIFDTGRWNNPSTIPVPMRQWLKDDLAKAQNARYRIVVMHRPYWYMDHFRNGRDPIGGIMRSGKVDLVLAGHSHYYSSAVEEGIRYINVPSSGALVSGLGSDSFYGYVWLAVSDEGISWTAVRLGNQVNPDTIPLEINYLLIILLSAFCGLFGDVLGARLRMSLGFPFTVKVIMGKVMGWLILAVMFCYAWVGCQGFAGVLYEQEMLPWGEPTIVAPMVSVIFNLLFGPLFILFHRFWDNMISRKRDWKNMKSALWALLWFSFPAIAVLYALSEGFQPLQIMLWFVVMGVVLEFCARSPHRSIQ